MNTTVRPALRPSPGRSAPVAAAAVIVLLAGVVDRLLAGGTVGAYDPATTHRARGRARSTERDRAGGS